jgi:hypothetical protein
MNTDLNAEARRRRGEKGTEGNPAEIPAVRQDGAVEIRSRLRLHKAFLRVSAPLS